MKAMLSELETDFVRLSILDQAAIKGGKGIKLSDDQLRQMFDYTGAGGFDSEVSAKWNLQLRNLASTDTGASLLRSLMASAPAKIKLDSVNTGAGYASYDATTDTLNIKAFNTVNMSLMTQFSQTLAATAHEMYHAFQDMFWKTLTGYEANRSVSVELDAYLFDSKVLKQYQAVIGSTVNYSQLAGMGAYMNDPTKNGGAAFKSAWEDIINNNGFTLEKYNTLMAGFKSTGVNHTGSYTWLDETARTSGQLEIDKVLYNDGSLQVVKPGTGPAVIEPVGPYDPLDPYFGNDWDSSDPFNDPYFWGYDPNYIDFSSWWFFMNSGYSGADPGSGTNPDSNSGTNDNYYNDTGYVQYWFNTETGSGYYLSSGDHAPGGFEFGYSQDPNNPGGYDEYGHDPSGYDMDGYDENGFDRDGFNEYGLDENGMTETGYDPEGYDENGYDQDGYTRDGMDEDGYDRDGKDANGNTREDNGDY